MDTSSVSPLQLLTLPLVGSVVGALLSWLLNEFSAPRRALIARTDRLLFENLEKRQQAYEQLYSAVLDLERYFLPWVAQGEYQQGPGEDELFAPSASIDAFGLEVAKVELWLAPDTRAAIEEVVSQASMGNSVSTCLALERMKEAPSDEDREFLYTMERSTRDLSNLVLEKTKSLKSSMRASLGLELLDREVTAAAAKPALKAPSRGPKRTLSARR